MKETEWKAFLLKSENLACALEVGSHYSALKHAALDDLFERLQSGLDRHLKAKDAAGTWSACRDKASDDWPAVYTWPNNHPDSCPGVYLRLERGAYQKQPRMVLGVGTTTGRANLEPKSLQRLVDALEARDFSVSQPSWVRRRWLEYFPNDHDFCIDVIASDRSEKDLLEAMKDTFDEFRELMELVNQRERAHFRKLKEERRPVS